MGVNLSNNTIHTNEEDRTDYDIRQCVEYMPYTAEVGIRGCQDSIIYDLGNIDLESTGHIIQLRMTLKNVYPGRRIALAVLLYEIDDVGNETKCGLKTINIPAHHQPLATDIELRSIRFVLPNDDYHDNAHSVSRCGKRNFIARTIAHYIDHDFEWDKNIEDAN